MAPFFLEPLPYGESDLQPLLSEECLQAHHTVRGTFICGRLNTECFGVPELSSRSLEELMTAEDVPAKVRIYAADIWNHNFYFSCMSPEAVPEPEGRLAEAVTLSFGSFQAFKDKFSGIALALFGSGFVWLVHTKGAKKAAAPTTTTTTKGPEAAAAATAAAGPLRIVGTKDLANPVTLGLGSALLGLDLWEHAYYEDYRNDRAGYVTDWLQIVDWTAVGKRYEAADPDSCTVQ